MNSKISNLFINKFHSINKEIGFNSKWSIGYNDIGKDLEYAYFDKMLNSEDRVVIAKGDIAKCVEPSPYSRKIIIIGTVYGTLLVFNRYGGCYSRITTNVTDGEMYDRGILPFGILTMYELNSLFNTFCIDDYCI